MNELVNGDTLIERILLLIVRIPLDDDIPVSTNELRVTNE
jgi:hypothetical protein